MIGRKIMGRASPILLVLLALGFFFASYNLLTLVIHNKTSYSGLWGADQLIEPVIQRRENAKNSKYHVALTATDAPYSQWQCRIMYYWYKKVKDMPGSDMGKFTRVLHSGNADNLMEEIPTVVVDPLPEGLDRQEQIAKIKNSLWPLASHQRCPVEKLEKFRHRTGLRRHDKGALDLSKSTCASHTSRKSQNFVKHRLTWTWSDSKAPSWCDAKGWCDAGIFFIVLLDTFGAMPKAGGYIVLNRPWAFVQWLEKATIEEEYILMAEPDHIFVNPLPNLAHGNSPAGYPFFYIKPAENEKIIRKFYPEEKGPVTDIDPIGNSPVIIKKSLLEEIAPTWVNVSLRMKDDPETDKAFGWVLEMYAYAVASALHGVRHILRKDFMLQPPWDLEVGKTFIIHYTYGCDYNLKGELTYGKIGEWRFDKRSYLSGPPPRNLSLPPPGVPESVIRLVKMVNEATANIPGWDTLTSG